MEGGDCCSNDIGGSNRICWGGDVGGDVGGGIGGGMTVLCKAGLSYFVIIILFHSPLADRNGAAM